MLRVAAMFAQRTIALSARCEFSAISPSSRQITQSILNPCNIVVAGDLHLQLALSRMDVLEERILKIHHPLGKNRHLGINNNEDLIEWQPPRFVLGEKRPHRV